MCHVTLGYRAMHQRLTSDYGLVVTRSVVRQILKILDPECVEARSRHRLRRRQYCAKGPNYLWHIDGYDKLKPFGFSIHGAIDGYSRRILWLEVSSSNNDPAIIAHFYYKCARLLRGTASIIRADRGTENVNVAAIGARRVPTEEGRRDIILELAHKELIQRVQFVIDNWRKPLRVGLGNIAWFTSIVE